MKTLFKEGSKVLVAAFITGSLIYGFEPQQNVQASDNQVAIVQDVKKSSETSVKAPETPSKQEVVETPDSTPTAVTEPVTTPDPVVAPIQDNESIVWNYLRARGFIPAQASAIMGNLQQEHNFQTSDEPGGLGLGQWTGARRDKLMTWNNYLDINVQLTYLTAELNGTEHAALTGFRNVTDIDGMTIMFQNAFERCDPAACNQDQRITNAHNILAKYWQ